MTDEKRPYRMKRRAEAEAETRRRITESTVELHRTLGPSRTSISAVAEHAGVRRSTVYRHFPDELALFEACTGHWMAANPLPSIDAWLELGDLEERLQAALTELYAYYGRTERMMDNLIRDEEALPIVKQLFSGYRDYIAAGRDALMSAQRTRGRSRQRVGAAIGHALAFTTWRSLAREQGLEDAQAVDLMCRMVAMAGATSR